VCARLLVVGCWLLVVVVDGVAACWLLVVSCCLLCWSVVFLDSKKGRKEGEERRGEERSRISPKNLLCVRERLSLSLSLSSLF